MKNQDHPPSPGERLPARDPVAPVAMRLFATAPKALAPLLASELRAMGAHNVRELGAGVAFAGDLAMAYRVCLWSRLASRVLMPIADAAAADGDQLYADARQVDWAAHLTTDCTFAVDCTVRNARITHSHYAALRVKDAIVDQFRDKQGRRPSIDTEQPDIRIHLHLQGSKAQIALDLSGGGLHRRGYRVEAGVAPLRETLAAGLLQYAGWPNRKRYEGLLDPMCGSGTLPIEAAMMAADIAPGLHRTHFSFLSWPGHDAQRWQELIDDALERRERGLSRMPQIVAADHDADVIAIAMRNVDRAGLHRNIELRTCEVRDWQQHNSLPARGLLVANPPYGPRMDAEEAARCMEQLHSLCTTKLARWSHAILMPDPQRGSGDSGWPHNAGDSRESLAVNNGALACRIYNINTPAGVREKHAPEPRPRKAPAKRASARTATVQPLQGVTIDTAELANRLTKNERKLRAWIKRENVSCYRLYDADLPQFALAIDLYHTVDPSQRWVCVQEYAPPPSIDLAMAASRREAALAALPDALGVDPSQVLFKTRQRQRGAQQYERQQREERYLRVREGDCTLLVNLHDFLDTGLFLDHRPVRRWIGEHSNGTRFLNLFGYTGSASVHAARGGALSTTTIDMSAAYCTWCEKNLQLNDFRSPEHVVLREDCLQWLHSTDGQEAGLFDLVFLDPPTFSNSKRMEDSFDVQRDHVPLINAAMQRLSDDGTLIFSSNRRGMKLDEHALQHLQITNWSKPSVPPDFARAEPHRCWMIRHQR